MLTAEGKLHPEAKEIQGSGLVPVLDLIEGKNNGHGKMMRGLEGKG